MQEEELIKHIVDEELAVVNGKERIMSKLYLDIPLKGDKISQPMFIYAVDDKSWGADNGRRRIRIMIHLRKAIKAGKWTVEETKTEYFDHLARGLSDDKQGEASMVRETVKRITFSFGNTDNITRSHRIENLQRALRR